MTAGSRLRWSQDVGSAPEDLTFRYSDGALRAGPHPKDSPTKNGQRCGTRCRPLLLPRRCHASARGDLRCPGQDGGLGRLTIPTVVIHGENDPLVPPANGRQTAAALSRARLIMIPGMGHALPDHVWPQIVDAIAAVTPGSAAADGRVQVPAWSRRLTPTVTPTPVHPDAVRCSQPPPNGCRDVFACMAVHPLAFVVVESLPRPLVIAPAMGRTIVDHGDALPATISTTLAVWRERDRLASRPVSVEPYASSRGQPRRARAGCSVRPASAPEAFRHRCSCISSGWRRPVRLRLQQPS